MTSNFNYQPTMDVLINSDFRDQRHVSGAARGKMTSKTFADQDAIVSATTARKVAGGVVICHTTQIANLSAAHSVGHKFHFIDRIETRERFHVISPDEPSVSTELKILLEKEQSRDYFSVSTYDNAGHIVATDTLVFNAEGQIVSYPFTEDRVSPTLVESAYLRERTDDTDARFLEFGIVLLGLNRETDISMLWESIGSIERQTFSCGPNEETHVAISMPLDHNSTAYPGDWVAIAVDAEERIIAQAHFNLKPS